MTMPVREISSVSKHGGAGSGVEEAVKKIDGPGAEGEGEGNPEGKGDVGGACKGESPEDGDGGRVEAGEVPEVERTQEG